MSFCQYCGQQLPCVCGFEGPNGIGRHVDGRVRPILFDKESGANLRTGGEKRFAYLDGKSPKQILQEHNVTGEAAYYVLYLGETEIEAIHKVQHITEIQLFTRGRKMSNTMVWNAADLTKI
jgi:hypothetical protein